MIPEQLSLFGGPPKPPKVIRQEEALPPAEEAVQSSVPAAESLPTPAVDTGALPEEPVVPEQLETPVIAAEEVAPLVEEDPFAAFEPAPLTDDFSAFEATWQQQAPTEDMYLPTESAPDVPAPTEPTPAPSTAVLADEQVPPEMESVEEPVMDAREATVSIKADSLVRADEPIDEMPETALPATGAASPAIAFEPAEPEMPPAAPAAIDATGDAAVVQPPEVAADGPQLPPDEMLFKRQYYSMRETAGMFGISHSMLRYWENEFDVLQPRKNRKGDRYFRPIDIKNLHLIYNLLKVRKFTMDGAREYLRHHNKALDTFELVQKLEKLKTFLNELKATL